MIATSLLRGAPHVYIRTQKTLSFVFVYWFVLFMQSDCATFCGNAVVEAHQNALVDQTGVAATLQHQWRSSRIGPSRSAASRHVGEQQPQGA